MGDRGALTITAPSTEPKDVYRGYAADAYRIFRVFMPEDMAIAQMSIFASTLLSMGPCPYERGQRVFALRAAVTSVNWKAPYLKGFAPAPPKDSVLLLLSDGLRLSVADTAACFDLSQGSVRTRLRRLRQELRGTENPPPLSTPGHACHMVQEFIEDERDTPKKNAVDCPACEDYAACRDLTRQRLSSLVHTLPESLAEMPVSPLVARRGRKTVVNWAAAPWYIRVLAEGALATIIVMGVVFSLPKIKYVYELWVDQRLDLASLGELASSLNRPSNPPIEAQTPVPASESTAVGQKSQLATAPRTTVTSEFSDRDTASASSNKVYRILIKTDSPETLKPSVGKILMGVGATNPQPDAALGVELPGGVMFDVYLPIKSYRGILGELGRMGDMKVIITQSRLQTIPGKARVKIWLQRI